MTKTSPQAPRRHAGGRPATGQMTAQFHVRIPVEWLPDFDRAAQEQGMTRAGLVRWLIGRHLKERRHDPE